MILANCVIPCHNHLLFCFHRWGSLSRCVGLWLTLTSSSTHSSPTGSPGPLRKRTVSVNFWDTLPIISQNHPTRRSCSLFSSPRHYHFHSCYFCKEFSKSRNIFIFWNLWCSFYIFLFMLVFKFWRWYYSSVTYRFIFLVVFHSQPAIHAVINTVVFPWKWLRQLWNMKLMNMIWFLGKRGQHFRVSFKHFLCKYSHLHCHVSHVQVQDINPVIYESYIRLCYIHEH